MNNKYIIRVKHPLIRPGIEIETEASERYLIPVLETLLDKIREFNLADRKTPTPEILERVKGEK